VCQFGADLVVSVDPDEISEPRPSAIPPPLGIGQHHRLRGGPRPGKRDRYFFEHSHESVASVSQFAVAQAEASCTAATSMDVGDLGSVTIRSPSG
jgi:hypothetical protein